MTSSNIYYVYAYLRKDLSPYYIGKGQGSRMFKKHNIKVPTDKSRIIVIAHKLWEHEAFLLETKLIALYGRKDTGTGILRNLTDGGEGASGSRRSEDAKSRIAAAKAKWHKLNDISGANNPMYGKKHSEEVCVASRERAERTGFIGCRKGKIPWNKGKKWSLDAEIRKKMSASRLKTPKVECPHCKKIVAPHILSRWHGDNCKLSPNNNLVS